MNFIKTYISARNKKANTVVVVFLLGLILNTAFAQKVKYQDGFPYINIGNGKLKATILLPDTANGYYRAVRFDWSGFMAQVTYKKHTFFQEWKGYIGKTDTFGIHDPYNTGTGTGISEEFRKPLNYQEAKAGEPFVKVGVGTLLKDKDTAYYFAKRYTIINHGKWETTYGKDWVLFTHTLSTDDGYGYIYTKKITLLPNSTVIKVFHSLKNTGIKPIETTTYSHNFFRFDDNPSSDNYVLTYPSPINPKNTFSAKAHFGATTFQLADELVGAAPVEGAYNTNGVNEFELANTKTKTAVHVKGDKPVIAPYLYIWRNAFCPEHMIAVLVSVGEATSWETVYSFKAN
ncbi:hypothetical protein [Parasediminibacterium sp. JCM 36343]|uniref:hypothetical protein n=1 Tax=Parasediminibacterium sp. JCM 36343 TaxID=3374279 RepID=UPI00397C69AE